MCDATDASSVICYPWVFMRAFDFLRAIKSPEHRLALLVAIGADAIQIVALPLFAGGGLAPADTLLDLAVAAILIRCLGWHWAFLPTLLAELIPGFDLFPTWTAAVLYVTNQQVRAGEPEILPPGPAPARRP
jgi:quinol-cytochrome oxidoreductase complex cytochrome b subunit